MYLKIILFVLVLLCVCDGISNNNFNSQIRDNYVPDDSINLTDVKTLQKQGLGRYASYVPDHKSVKFKFHNYSQEVPDSSLSSSHSRGLVHHEQTGTGYGLTDYDDPHFAHGLEHDIGHPYIDYHGPGHHYVPNHHLGYGHHHKHYDNGLATKALLWPIAGIALLGAAAALISNPVLLQLGVVSGKRKRRQTEDFEFARNSIKKWSEELKTKDVAAETIKKRVPRKSNVNNELKKVDKPMFSISNAEMEDDRFIPIPLKYKHA